MNDTDTKTETNNEWSKREIGALWLKQGTNQKYFSGHVKMQDEFGTETTTRLVVFSNKSKTKNNQPDFRIYLSKDREEQPVKQESSSESSSPSSEVAEAETSSVLSVEDTL